MDNQFNPSSLPVGAVPYHEHLDKRFPSCDEQCIPKGHPHDLSEFSALFGTQTTIHYDRSHDDACLDKNGCPGLGLDTGLDNNKAHPAFESILGLWDRPATSVHLHLPLANVPQVDLSSEVCSMTLSFSDDCCNSSCLDEDACSTGTCDPDTFCRDENCPKPQVGHDVAHGATILQEISGAKSNQQHLDPDSPRPVERLDSSYSYTPHSLEQSYPFQLEYPDAYLADQVDPFGGASEGQHGHHGADRTSQDYPEAYDTSQGYHRPQTTSLGSPAQYASVPHHHSQSFHVMQGLGSAATPSNFPLDAAYSPNHTLGSLFEQAHTQQSHWNYTSPHINPNLPGPPSIPWTAAQDEFNFNSPLTGQNPGSLYGQHPLNGGIPSPNGLMYRPVSRGQPTSARSLQNITDTPSPRLNLTGCEPQEHGMHTCQWQIDGDRLCDKKFKDKRGLYDHIAETHIDALQANGQDGFMCHWAGCPRQTDEKCESKRGFTARSKLKRHITIHTGPVDSYICNICGKPCSSSQALNIHLVIHSEERPYKCDEKNCNKAFKTADSLKVHKQNVHSEDKPHICPICDKAFKDSSNFSKHKATHSNDKPWSCEHCNETFARRDQLLRHATRLHRILLVDLNVLYPKRVRGARARSVSS